MTIDSFPIDIGIVCILFFTDNGVMNIKSTHSQTWQDDTRRLGA